MNNSLVLFLVGGVVVLGGGFLLYSTMSDSRDSQNRTEEHAGDHTRGTLTSLMMSGQSLECTFQHNDGTNVSSGTVYLAGGATRIRGDFNITQSGAGAMQASMIRDGGYNYLWGSALPQGIKIKVSAENEGTLFDDSTGAVDENTEFECHPWRVDNSKFSLPEGVEFVDMSSMMPQGNVNVQDSGNIQTAQCAACSQIPEGAARQQCLVTLKCN